MIPKRIVYTWINNGIAESPVMQRCLASWRQHLPDYEVVRIGLENVSRKSRYVREALAAGRWVQASNYARLEELYEHGGLYFDVDVEVIRSFDDLLSGSCFLGVESANRVNQAVLGAEPRHWFFKECMERIEKGFRGDAPPETAAQTGPLIVTDVLRDHGWKPGNRTSLVEDVRVFESVYFYPYHYTGTYSPECVSERTYCVHRWSHAWLPWGKRLKLAVLGKGVIGDLRVWVATARGRNRVSSEFLE